MPHLYTECSSGFAIKPLSNPNPACWRMATAAEVNANLAKAKACCDTQGAWAILAFENGKIAGSGYGYEIQIGNQDAAGSKLLIKA